MDIEEVNRTRPEAVVKEPIDPTVGIDLALAREIIRKAAIPEHSAEDAAQFLVKLYEGFVDSDATLYEVNPLLRTPDTANDAEVSRKVRETLARAGDNLNKINYNGLNQGAKGQHDTARRFIAQAEDALKSKNLVFARYLADKAENISASLINR